MPATPPPSKQAEPQTLPTLEELRVHSVRGLAERLARERGANAKVLETAKILSVKQVHSQAMDQFLSGTGIPHADVVARLKDTAEAFSVVALAFAQAAAVVEAHPGTMKTRPHPGGLESFRSFD
jgi:hypothetical protein